MSIYSKVIEGLRLGNDGSGRADGVFDNSGCGFADMRVEDARSSAVRRASVDRQRVDGRDYFVNKI